MTTIESPSARSSAPASPPRDAGAAPALSVSIVHWNGGAATIACIESVLAERYPNLSLVLVDNGSTDGVADVVATRWPEATVIRKPDNTGFTGGQNAGMAAACAAGADYVLLLNQDALLVPGCLAKLVALAEADERTGLVSPMIYFADEPGRLQFCGSWLDRPAMAVHYDGDLAVVRRHDADAGSVMCLWGTALLIRRAVIDRIGFLDDRLFAYFEDTDYSVRAADAGWRNHMCFDAGILHEGHPTRYTRAPNFFYFTARNEMLFWRNTLGRRDALRVRRVCVARSLREAAKLRDAGLHAQASACVLGLLDGFAGRYGGFDPDRKPPALLRNALLRHPYLLADLLEGRLPAMARTVHE